MKMINFKKICFGMCVGLVSLNVFAFGIGSTVSHFISKQVEEKISQPNTTQSQNVASDISKRTDPKQSGQCEQHYPLGIPVVADNNPDKDKLQRRSFFTCRMAYATQFDPAKKTPLWVSEVLTAESVADDSEPRVDNFQPDPFIPGPAQATLNDYKGTHFDRGHMAPAADMRFNATAMDESFYLTNMVPQVGANMNRGIWADLEKQIRIWTKNRGKIFVVTGPVFNGQYDAIGKSGVTVPTHLYKIIIDLKTKESLAFLMPNVQVITKKTKHLDEGSLEHPQTLPKYAYNCGDVCEIDNFLTSIREIEKLTGLNFNKNLSQKEQDSIEINRNAKWRK